MSDEAPSGPNVPAILAAREVMRARLAPTGKDLERLLIELHTQSAEAQRKARKQQAKLRAELNRRLEEGETLVIHGNEVVVARAQKPQPAGVSPERHVDPARRPGSCSAWEEKFPHWRVLFPIAVPRHGDRSEHSRHCPTFRAVSVWHRGCSYDPISARQLSRATCKRRGLGPAGLGRDERSF